MTGPAIHLHDVTIAYERHPAVHHVSGTFEPGSLTAIIGPNGAGKSTLLKAIMGEITRYDGHIDRGGLALRDMGYLPQAAEIDRQFPLSVADVVLLGGWHETGALGRVRANLAARAGLALTAVGLEGFGARRIDALSAGQFQRVLFARLLLQDSAIIVLDEPFTAIDARTTADLLAIVQRWHAEGRTVIAVLHDFAQVRAHFPSSLLLARERIAWGPTKAVLTADHLQRARVLAQSWDSGEATVCRISEQDIV